MAHNIDKIREARWVVMQKAPYFASALYKLKIIKTPVVPTMGIRDDLTLLYNDEFVEDLSLTQTATALVHEIMHVLSAYFERARAYGIKTHDDSKIWNVAGDCVINPIIAEAHWDLVKGALFPKTFNLPEKGTTEEYYDMLNERRDEILPLLSDKIMPCISLSGSCASGVRSPCEEGFEENSLVSSEFARDLLRRSMAQDMKAYAAKHPGSLPSDLQRIVDDLLEPPRVPWRTLFASSMRSAIFAPGAVDYSRQRPSRRQMVTPDVLRMGMVRPVPNLVLLLDSSGSMGGPEFVEILSEVGGIIHALGITTPLKIISVDAEVHGGVQQVWKPSQINIIGGGGTDMGEGLRYAAKINPRPDIAIVATDGWTPWPDRNPVPGSRVIVLLVGEDSADESTAPSWARAIKVDD